MIRLDGTADTDGCGHDGTILVSPQTARLGLHRSGVVLCCMKYTPLSPELYDYLAQHGHNG